MDLVISDVATVEEDDDEPLYIIKKVRVFKEKKDYQIGDKSKVKVNSTYKKNCYVPLCPNTTVTTPEKMFITVPVNPVRRKKWFDAVGKTLGKNPKSPVFCCQDHFNLAKDMKNYAEHLEKGKVQMNLYPDVIPHIFLCNEYGHLDKKTRVATLQELHRQTELANYLEVKPEEQSVPNRVQQKRKSRGPNRPAKRRQKLKGKTVFVEIPSFNQSECDEIDTIVIDDSDTDES